MDMNMPGMATPTSPASAASTSAAAGGMGGMGGMGKPGACKISMLWNWYTIDTCFIASSWHVRSAGTFAVSCIGVVLLVVLLEFLRRSTKEFDRFLISRHRSGEANDGRSGAAPAVVSHRASSSSSAAAADHGDTKATLATGAAAAAGAANGHGPDAMACGQQPARRSLWDVMFFRRARMVSVGAEEPYLPTMPEQAVRALLHMFQFAVAYFVMLLAMYYNGYIIICIFIGAFLGSFIFQHEELGRQRGKTSAANEATVCCG